MQRYSKFGYVKDVLVGAISCKEDIYEDRKECYIMTITVLKPYRRYGIASQLLKQAIQDCMVARDVRRMVLHVQSNNEQALEFYKKHGFVVESHLENYYTDLTPSDCYFLVKTLDPEDASAAEESKAVWLEILNLIDENLMSWEK